MDEENNKPIIVAEKKTKSNKKLIFIHFIATIIVIALGFVIYFAKDNISSIFSSDKSTTTASKDDKKSTVELKPISFDPSVEAPVEFTYPGTWTVTRHNTAFLEPGNSSGIYDSIMITSPSGEITVSLRADHNFIGQAGGCTAEGFSWARLPFDVVKLKNYTDIYYIETISQKNINDASQGLYFSANLSEPTPCMGSQIIYNSSNRYYFTAYIEVKEFSSYTNCAENCVEISPQVVITQEMIDRVIATDEFKTAKTILLSATAIK